MSKSNVDLARDWMHDVWNKRLDATVDALLGADSIGHSYGNPDIVGREGFRAFRDTMQTAFPDLKIHLDGVMGNGDDVAVRWRATGTHDGVAMGLQPTRKQVEFWGITWLKLSDGKIVEGWDAWNQGQLMTTLAGP
jgi:steroid delta-isomerase-like uncharacterized protein